METEIDLAEEPTTRSRVLSILASGVVVLSVLAQGALIALLIDYQAAPSSESRGFQGMGILMLLFGALWVVVPGTLIAFVRMVRAALQLNLQERARSRLVANLLILLLPLGVIWTLQWSDKPKVPATSPKTVLSPAGQRTAGMEWASNEGITNEEKCNQGTPEFVAGCKSYVKRTK